MGGGLRNRQIYEVELNDSMTENSLSDEREGGKGQVYGLGTWENGWAIC